MKIFITIVNIVGLIGLALIVIPLIVMWSGKASEGFRQVGFIYPILGMILIVLPVLVHGILFLIKLFR